MSSRTQRGHYDRVPLPLSVLDQSPISVGMTGGDALRNSIDLAQHVEALGDERYWIAEHHGTPMLARAGPEILVAAGAGATARVQGRGGCGVGPRARPLACAVGCTMP